MTGMIPSEWKKACNNVLHVKWIVCISAKYMYLYINDQPAIMSKTFNVTDQKHKSFVLLIDVN